MDNIVGSTCIILSMVYRMIMLWHVSTPNTPFIDERSNHRTRLHKVLSVIVAWGNKRRVSSAEKNLRAQVCYPKWFGALKPGLLVMAQIAQLVLAAVALLVVLQTYHGQAQRRYVGKVVCVFTFILCLHVRTSYVQCLLPASQSATILPDLYNWVVHVVLRVLVVEMQQVRENFRSTCRAQN